MPLIDAAKGGIGGGGARLTPMGCEVLALTANTATIRRPSDSTTTYRKNNTPAFGGPSDSLDDLQ